MYTRANLASIRVKKDLAELTSSISNGDVDWQQASASIDFPDGQRNLLKLCVNVTVRAGAYQGGVYSFRIDVPHTYPFHAPSVTSLTRIWHPGVDLQTGKVKLPILEEDWRPVLGLQTLVLAIQLMLLEPSSEGRAVINWEAAHALSRPWVYQEQVRRIARGDNLVSVTIATGGAGAQEGQKRKRDLGGGGGDGNDMDVELYDNLQAMRIQEELGQEKRVRPRRSSLPSSVGLQAVG
jgi:ubiquitin-conjugating enzyme E2 M